jgi:hypothetical protein
VFYCVPFLFVLSSARLVKVMDVDEFDVVVTTYEQLVAAQTTFSARARHWSYLIVDEVCVRCLCCALCAVR